MSEHLESHREDIDEKIRKFVASEEYKRAVRQMSRYQLPLQDLEDAIQETLITIIKKEDQIQDISGWFTITLRNRCVVKWRNKRASRISNVDTEALQLIADKDLEDTYSIRDLQIDIGTAISICLSPSERLLMRLKYEGRSDEEIAKASKYHVTSLRKVFNRAMDKVRKQLGLPSLKKIKEEINPLVLELRNAHEYLSQKPYQIYYLVEIRGLSIPQVAKLLKITKEAVSTNLNVALYKIEKLSMADKEQLLSEFKKIELGISVPESSNPFNNLVQELKDQHSLFFRKRYLIYYLSVIRALSPEQIAKLLHVSRESIFNSLQIGIRSVEEMSEEEKLLFLKELGEIQSDLPLL